MKMLALHDVLPFNAASNFRIMVRQGKMPRAWYDRRHDLHHSRYYIPVDMVDAVRAFMGRHSQKERMK